MHKAKKKVFFGHTLKVKAVAAWPECAMQGSSAADDEIAQFDVVKKRRRMEDAAADDPNSTDDPEALARFELFESEVLSALLNIQADDELVRAREMQEMKQDSINHTIVSDKS